MATKVRRSGHPNYMKLLLIPSLILLIPYISHAQLPLPTIEKLDETTAEKVLFLNPEYLAFSPETVSPEKKIPLLIYLHGAGGLGPEILKISGQPKGILLGIQKFKKGPCLVVAPQCMRSSKKSPLKSTWEAEDLDLFLTHLLEKYTYVDHNRIYLTGNSMGGFGSWMWGGNAPQHFAAIAPLVGGIGRGGPKDVTPDLDKWAANLATVPVWAFVGAKDNVVPADRSERMVAAIKKAGGKQVKLLVYPEEGHGAGRRVFQSQEFYDWMFSQKRQEKGN